VGAVGSGGLKRDDLDDPVAIEVAERRVDRRVDRRGGPARSRRPAACAKASRSLATGSTPRCASMRSTTTPAWFSAMFCMESSVFS
jgi:hypothetical protein